MQHLLLILLSIASLRVQYDAAALSAAIGVEEQTLAPEQLQRPWLRLSEDMLADGQVVEVSFDELSHEVHQYSYTVRHCDKHWREDNLATTDYLRGFTTADITDYEPSFNTQQLYTHYRFTFPSEDMQPTVSGNYRILIYEDGRQEEPVATAEVMVVEPEVTIRPKVRYDTQREIAGRYQQLDIDVETGHLRVLAPDELTLCVLQNNRRDNCVYVSRPTFVEQARMRYINNSALIFPAGNEYRHLDISSEYIKGSEVDRILYDHSSGQYHAVLYPSERRNRGYLYDRDANGLFVVHAEKRSEADIEADYMWVHWQLPAAETLTGYRLTGDAFPTAPRMYFDEQSGAYCYDAYLKQGGYEWLYLGDGAEGDYWQTHNSYRILVYFRGMGDRFDRLVGLKDAEN